MDDAHPRDLEIRDDDGTPLLEAHAVRLGGALARGADGAAPDDPACLRFPGGEALWLPAGEARDLLPRLAAVRGPGVPQPAAVDAYRIGIAAPAAQLAAWFERRQLGGEPGLYRMDLGGAVVGIQADAPPSADDPMLLFIHGTAASCPATFRALTAAGDAHAAARATLARRYGKRVYGWQYRSLTTGPLANALALAELLPAGSRLDLVTHSQGGLLGELLCLGQRGGGFVPDLPDADEQAALRRLLALLDDKDIRVGRYVRIACPALGTTLASGRLDRWLSVFLFALTVGGLHPLAAELLALVLAVVKQRTDPRTLPGLASMMPDAPLLRLLNHPRAGTAADLSVIAGDADAGTVWRRLELALADRFFEGRNDLVVNTGSMFGGLRRTHARQLLESGPRISHFAYLAQPDVIAAVVAGLTREDGDDAGYGPLLESMRQEPARALAARPGAADWPDGTAAETAGALEGTAEMGGPRQFLAAKMDDRLDSPAAEAAGTPAGTGGSLHIQAAEPGRPQYGPAAEAAGTPGGAPAGTGGSLHAHLAETEGPQNDPAAETADAPHIQAAGTAGPQHGPAAAGSAGAPGGAAPAEGAAGMTDVAALAGRPPDAGAQTAAAGGPVEGGSAAAASAGAIAGSGVAAAGSRLAPSAGIALADGHAVLASPAAPPRVLLRVRHGDLARAGRPVCVGHYEGDALVHAEARLDALLGGRLALRAALGIYPGAQGTYLTCLAPDGGADGPAGALVLGLGRVGELAPAPLEATLHHALLDHALHAAAWHDAHGTPEAARGARLAFLLVGTGAGGVALRASLLAILRGVRDANAALAQRGAAAAITAVDILELYQDLALQAAAQLGRLLEDAEWRAAFDWPVAVVEDAGGGLVRARGEEAPGWWRRLEIAARGDALHFTALTERARAERMLLPGRTRLVRDLLAQATGGEARDGDIARTLFEMLVPHPLKPYLAERRDTVLVLDEQAAALPWELLEDRWSGHDIPPAAAAGLIRQLRLARFRAQPLHPVERSALVIGTPSLRGAEAAATDGYDDLPGARTEAAGVARLLDGAGYAASAEIDADATSIVLALHARPWRLLHLAGHGVLDFATDTGRATGMLVGPGIVLEPADVAQMRWVPELVFVNCCYLGASGAAPHRPELAAGMAAQFIALGVKAVVAAGWSVGDNAGATFALAFYGALLAGATFGDAVRTARLAVWRAHPGSNTWGAYQCYGDPAYTLAGAPGATQGEAPPAAPFLGRAELVCALDNLLAGAGGTVAALRERIPAAVRDAWLAAPDVAARLAALGWSA